MIAENNSGGRAKGTGATIIRYRGVVKRFGKFTALDGVFPGRSCGRRGLPDRAVGLGQIDAASLHEWTRNDRRRRNRVRGWDAAARDDGRRHARDVLRAS